MKKLLKILGLVFVAFYAGAKGIMKVEGADGKGTLTAIPVKDNTVLKFEGDSVKISLGSYETFFFKDEVISFDFQENFLSELTFNISTDNDLQIPLQDAIVALYGEDSKDFLAIIQKSDSTGRASFGHLPTGFYCVKVGDRDNVFHPLETGPLLHTFNDTMSLMLRENVLIPDTIHYDIIPKAQDLYDLDLTWRMGDENSFGPFRNYLFIVTLNDDYLGETEDTRFRIENVRPGEHNVAISVATGYGYYGEEPYELLISIIPEEIETGAGIIDIEENECYEYFDLNGLRVKNPGSGIFIRKSSTGKMEKIIRRG